MSCPITPDVNCESAVHAVTPVGTARLDAASDECTLLYSMPWFHGKIGRTRAVEMLYHSTTTHVLPPASNMFLVREKEPGFSYAVSILSPRESSEFERSRDANRTPGGNDGNPSNGDSGGGKVCGADVQNVYVSGDIPDTPATQGYVYHALTHHLVQRATRRDGTCGRHFILNDTTRLLTCTSIFAVIAEMSLPDAVRLPELRDIPGLPLNNICVHPRPCFSFRAEFAAPDQETTRQSTPPPDATRPPGQQQQEPRLARDSREDRQSMLDFPELPTTLPKGLLPSDGANDAESAGNVSSRASLADGVGSDRGSYTPKRSANTYPSSNTVCADVACSLQPSPTQQERAVPGCVVQECTHQQSHQRVGSISAQQTAASETHCTNTRRERTQCGRHVTRDSRDATHAAASRRDDRAPTGCLEMRPPNARDSEALHVPCVLPPIAGMPAHRQRNHLGVRGSSGATCVRGSSGTTGDGICDEYVTFGPAPVHCAVAFHDGNLFTAAHQPVRMMS